MLWSDIQKQERQRLTVRPNLFQMEGSLNYYSWEYWREFCVIKNTTSAQSRKVDSLLQIFLNIV